MQYRPFGTTGFQVSALGFGAMRLPLRGPGAGDIDEPQVVRMIRTAIDAGVNYVDTAYGYHDGRSEVVVGQALRDGYRHRIKLATKLPSWQVKTVDDFDTFLSQQLGRLQTEQIDFYLLHNLNATWWPRMKELGILERAERALRDGRIGALGFSFHDQLPLFKEIVDAYHWNLCQIQYNFMDIAYQAGREGLEYATGRGVPVVVMEPIRGGQLAQEPPPAVAEIWTRSALRTTPADRALQWLWDQPAVTMVLSGMSTMEQVEQNLVSAARSRPNSLPETERVLYLHAKAAYEGLKPIPCTQCKYCLPCPNGVDVPRNFELYNDTVIYGHTEKTQRTYRMFFPAENHADRCQRCGECEPKCPQNIPIMEWLPKVEARLGTPAPSQVKGS
ncbi:MAG: aldo/keto reductase [Bryobacteraceae bacterium]|jgi:predicted aldo/keto reductase-like oxidoreductase